MAGSPVQSAGKVACQALGKMFDFVCHTTLQIRVCSAHSGMNLKGLAMGSMMQCHRHRFSSGEDKATDKIQQYRVEKTNEKV